MSALVTTAENLAIAAQPWLGYPGVKQIWEALFSFVADKFTQAAQTEGTFIVIDLQVDGEQTNVSKELAALVAAEKLGDMAALKVAIQNYANANSALVHSDGSAPATG